MRTTLVRMETCPEDGMVGHFYENVNEKKTGIGKKKEKKTVSENDYVEFLAKNDDNANGHEFKHFYDDLN